MGVVVITGCSSGIGLETALAFGRAGETVYATMRATAKSGPLLDASARDGSRIEVVEMDVTDDASVNAAAEEILDATGGRVDVVVNNAGIGAVGAVENIGLDQARWVMETNFWGPVRVVRAFVPAMRRSGGGVVVNVSSVAGRTPPAPCLGFYAASKHALGAISEALRYEVTRDGIRVVVVEPGFHRSEVEANLPPVDATSPYADLAARTRQITVDGVRAGGDPVDVADAIVAAAHDHASPLHVPVGVDAVRSISFYESRGLPAWDHSTHAIFGDGVPLP
jgi:NAD(P)-dependent dehydrogenase (short-subunit alcohol dehydrogenase family)